MYTPNYLKKSFTRCLRIGQIRAQHQCPRFSDLRAHLAWLTTVSTDKWDACFSKCSWWAQKTRWILFPIAKRSRACVWLWCLRIYRRYIGRVPPPPIPWSHLLHYTDGPQSPKKDTKLHECLPQLARWRFKLTQMEFAVGNWAQIKHEVADALSGLSTGGYTAHQLKTYHRYVTRILTKKDWKYNREATGTLDDCIDERFTFISPRLPDVDLCCPSIRRRIKPHPCWRYW